jgi:hypothetical protein
LKVTLSVFGSRIFSVSGLEQLEEDVEASFTFTLATSNVAKVTQMLQDLAFINITSKRL